MNLSALVLPSLIAMCAIVGVAILGMASARLQRELRLRRETPARERLADLPVQVLLDDVPPGAPEKGVARDMARELVGEAAAAVGGPEHRRAVRWFEQNGYVDEEAQGLTARQGWRRAQAAFRLGRMGSRTAEPALIRGLDDPRYGVRDACVSALGRVGGAGAAEALLRSLERRRIPEGLASGALLHLSEDADAALIAAMDHPDARMRGLVASLLGMRRVAAASDVLARGLSDPDPGVRRRSALALADIGPEVIPLRALDALRGLCADDASFVRAAAATALGAVMGNAAAPVLGGMARDEDFWVGYRAAEALANLPAGDALCWRLLADAEDSPEGERSRARVLEWLERTGGVERVLSRRLEHGQPVADLMAVLRRCGSRAWA